MLIPLKHTDPDRSVLAASAHLLGRLLRLRICSYDDLRTQVVEKFGSEALFLPAVSLLFLLGAVDYRSTTDSFEYLSRDRK